jgi:acetyl esterase/lipase
MRAFFANDILMLFDQGAGLHAIDRALLVLRCAWPEADYEELVRLPLGQRDRLLLEVRQGTFGDLLEAHTECPECRGRLEFSLSCAEMLANTPIEAVKPKPVTIEGTQFHLRCPNSRDAAAAAACTDVVTATGCLFERCVKPNGETDFLGDTISGSQRAVIAAALAALDPAAGTRHPMIVTIHGGPHGQQGPAFVHKAQVYAARGWASLMVNYRGSTGYGQAFSNAIAHDQDGGEAKDVMAAVDAALKKYPWIDADRLGVEGGSYGGQLSNWIVTQTTRFKAAIPWASISNIVSHNYMSVYHDYLEQEYDGKPHTAGIMDQLWERSAIRFVHRVKTPMMLSHGDNDLLVNPAEIEQYFTALKDVGVEVMMLRYPREGHGMRETQHVADFLDRSMAWYTRHFQAVPSQRTN